MASVTLLTGGNVPKGLESLTKERKEIRITDIVKKEVKMSKAKEVCHTIRHLKKTFTSDEWAEYCSECRHDEKKQIRTTIGKYVWNDFDICLNPEREEVTLKGGPLGYSATIKYAHCGNGVWAFGMDYTLGTEGGGFGVAWADKADTKLWNKGFESERECKKYAWRYILTYLQARKDNNKMIARLYDEVEKKYKQYSRPQIVQLELFT